MQAVIVQLETVWHDRNANHRKAAEMLRADPPAEGDLVVLPETFPVGFSMDVAAIADHEDSTGQFLSQIAAEYKVTVIGGNVTRPDDRARNVAIVANPNGQIVARYEKIHPFTFANEHNHYRGGDKIAHFDWNGASVSPMICYDLRFPEAFRIATKAGTEIFAVIANWPTARVNHWLALLTARAIENQAYVIACNRCGTDPNVAYPGRSVVIDPQGNTIGDAGDRERILKVEIDMNVLHDYRKAFPAIQDIRLL